MTTIRLWSRVCALALAFATTAWPQQEDGLPLPTTRSTTRATATAPSPAEEFQAAIGKSQEHLAAVRESVIKVQADASTALNQKTMRDTLNSRTRDILRQQGLTPEEIAQFLKPAEEAPSFGSLYTESLK